jgi:type IV pilus assembly protein PilC
MPQLEFGDKARVAVQPQKPAGRSTSRELEAMFGTDKRTRAPQPKARESSARPKSKDARKVKPKELAVFTRQFSVMIDAGLPLVQCLETLAGQQENEGFGRVLSGVRATVEGGSTLANALRQYPRIIDELYTNMVEAGETGGILDTILQRLSTYIEKAVKLKRAVQSAMIYPIAVLFIAAAVIFLLLWKVIPIFTQLFAEFSLALPLPTRIVIGLSHLVVSCAWVVILGVIGSSWIIRQYYQTPKGRMNLDTLILKTPVVGVIMKKIGVARFARTLGTLISSGVAMLEAMEITARTAGNAVLEKAILEVRAAVEQGRTIVDPLRETGQFPNMVVQMVGVGEQTGALDAMLAKMSDFYEDEVDAAVADLLTAMEPMMILFLGVVVGGIVISMYLPLFSLIGQLSQ